MLRLCLLLCLLPLALCVRAEAVTVAAAADLKFAMDAIVERYRQLHPDDAIALVYGSSGKFRTQIAQGAPYDLYFSADIAYPRMLAEDGLAASPVRAYAVGRLVLWSATLDASRLGLADLADPSIRRIAIANPLHAPYGKRAREALQAAGLWTGVESRIVYGDNIAHTAQLVLSGSADVGLIALSLALSPELAARGGHADVPQRLHSPLLQGYLVTRHGADNAAAHRFAAYIESAEAQAILARFGFERPG